MVRKPAPAVTRREGILHRPLPEPPAALRRGPLRPDAWASIARSERTAALLGTAVGLTFTICFVTGLLSHLAQHPPGWFSWPSRPVGLYRVTQGLHVVSGFAAIPLLLAKLWTVYPKLFEWPPLRTVAHAVGRLSLLVLVGAALFQLITGVLNVSRWYAPMPFFFTTTHYWTAWVVIGAIMVHVGSKLPEIRRGLARSPTTVTAPTAAEPEVDANPEFDADPGVAEDVGVAEDPGVAEDVGIDTLPGTDTEPVTDDQPVAGSEPQAAPRAGALSRRGFLVTVAATSGVIALTTVGQTVPALTGLTVLGARDPGLGSQGLPVNKSASSARVLESAVDPTYRLILDGPRPQELSLAVLLSLPRQSVTLPITCVEGWSASARWSGIRITDLLDLMGLDADAEVEVESLQEGGLYRSSRLSPPHSRDPLTTLALQVNGERLDLDHGYPLRLIAPNRPGVLQTKWISRIRAV